jgi:hypothetical protein
MRTAEPEDSDDPIRQAFHFSRLRKTGKFSPELSPDFIAAGARRSFENLHTSCRQGWLLPEDVEKRIVRICERGTTPTVNNIRHIESRSYDGVAVIRGGLQRDLHRERACAQVTSVVPGLLRTYSARWSSPGSKQKARAVKAKRIGFDAGLDSFDKNARPGTAT